MTLSAFQERSHTIEKMPISSSRRRFFSRLALFMALAAPCAASGQSNQPPRLPRGVDANDWEPYFDWGTEHLGKDLTASDSAIIWASRLRPDRAEPLYARWITFWARDIGLFEKYLLDDDRTLRDPRVIEAEALRERSFKRNPFVHQGMVFYLYQKLPGHIRDNPVSRAWFALGQGDLPRALDLFATVVARDPQRFGYLRFVRASAFANSGKPDSAAAEISALLAQLHAEDAKSLGNGYESKELLEYALGLIHLRRGRTAAAREAFGRALVENAAFAPAHAMLGEMAMNARDNATALLEYGLAVEIDSGDVESMVGLGRALRGANRSSEAVTQLRRAVALEPLYAGPYVFLAEALQQSGDKAGAADAYNGFLAHATQSDYRRADIQHKIQLLTSTP